MFKNHPTLKFVLDRSLWYALTLVVATTINFFLPRLGKANPIDMILSKQHGLTGEQAKEKEEAYLKEFGLVKIVDSVYSISQSSENPGSIYAYNKSDNVIGKWNPSYIDKTISSGKAIFDKDGKIASIDIDGDFNVIIDESNNYLITNDDNDTLFTASEDYVMNQKFSDNMDINDDGKTGWTYVSGLFLIEKSGNGYVKDVIEANVVSTLTPSILKSMSESKMANVTTKKVGDTELYVGTVSIERILRNEKGVTNKKGEDITGRPVLTPMVVQYINYLKMTFRGDLGTSFVKYPDKVNDFVKRALPWTIAIQLPTIVLGWFIGNLLGALAAYKRGWLDTILYPILMVFNSIPFFAVGMLLVYFFAEIWPIFPASGGYAPDILPGWNFSFMSSALFYYFLPFMSIFPVFAAGQAVGMRSMGIYELGTGYVKYSKTLGISENKILMYIFRNAMLPQLTGLALMLGSMIGGALITEMIFSYPGLGMALLTATTNNDYPMIQGSALLVTITVLIANFSVDMLIGFLDPRVKAGMAIG